MDSEPRFAEKRKAIRDKKERFFERKGGPEVAVPVVESASGADQERPAYSERVTGVRVKPRWETVALRSLAHRREERTRHGMLTRVARPFGAPSIGFPDSELEWPVSHSPGNSGSQGIAYQGDAQPAGDLGQTAENHVFEIR